MKSALPVAQSGTVSPNGLQAPPQPAAMANVPALPSFARPTFPDALATMKAPQLTAAAAQAMMANRPKTTSARATNFFASEVSLGPDGSGNIAYYLKALGTYTYGSPTPGAHPYNGWFYKYGFGWLFDLGSTSPSTSDVYFYDLDLGFIYTASNYGSDDSYLYFYDFAMGHNMVYFQSFDFPRYFYDFNTGKYLSSPPANTPNYVKGVAGVAQIPTTSTNAFSSSMLGASNDGTFVIQSADAPGTPQGSSFTLTEYTLTASESAAGITTTASKARAASTVGREGTNAVLPFRAHLDPRTGALKPFHGRSTMSVVRSRSMQGGLSAASGRRVSDIPANTQRTFHVQQGTITGVGATCTGPGQITVGPYCYADRPAHLLAVGTHAYVWVDDAIDSSYGFSQTDWNATAGAFDNDYARETAAFAPAFNAGLKPFNGTQSGGPTYTQCDANGKQLAQSFPPYQATPDLSGSDPHISILVTNALENSGEGGYFDVLNLLNDPEWNCAYGSSKHVPSNNLPMFVIGTDKYGSSADENFWRTQDMPRSVPHEFQHYLHALNKVLVPDLVNGQSGQFDDSFVDEGDSMLAEDLVLGSGANPPQSPDSQLLGWEYMFTPGNYSLTAFAGYDADPLSTAQNPPYGFYRYTSGNYGGAYLFARYLYDRFGGDTALHRVYADLTTAPTDGSANVYPIQAEANGESFAQVYGEFAGALAARNSATSDPRFRFSSNVLLDGLTTTAIPGGQTWNVRFNGPRSPEDLTSSTPGGQARIKLTPGGNVTIKLITGATVFPNVAAGGGAVVTGTVSGAPAFGVNGMMVQGAYQDSGACLGPSGAGGCN